MALPSLLLCDLWFCFFEFWFWFSLTHPVSWSDERFLFGSQFVQQVVGHLHASGPQFSCRTDTEFITPHPSNSEATERETTGVFVEALSRQDPGFRPVYVDCRVSFGAKRSNIILLIARLNKGWHHVATCVRRYWADVTLKLKCVLSADGWSGMEAITHQTHRGRHMSNTKFMIHKQLLI